MRSSKLQPAIVGGVVAGVLSSLPIVSVGNVCCCLWIVSGGLTAAYLLQQSHPAPLTAADGALVGLYAGLVGAVVALIITPIVSLVTGPFERALFERLAERTGRELPVALDGPMSAAMYLAFGCVMVFLSSIFSTIGGLLGAALFAKPAQPGIIDVPPQS
jgi:hypothetical protein